MSKHVVILCALLAAAACRPRSDSSPKANEPGASASSLMDPALWEPAGPLLSPIFPGTRADWLTRSDVWTLPGMGAPREVVVHQGKKRPNHQQYTVRSKESFGAFRLSLEFRFGPEKIDSLAATWLGNSGIYVFGLYEVQIFRAGYFVAEGEIARDAFPDGLVKVKRGPHDLKVPLNQFLCGAIYGGGLSDDPFAGVPETESGSYFNGCADEAGWHQLVIEFTPARFDGSVKVAAARVAVELGGRRLLYGGRDFYDLPGPTGSQQGKPEVAAGPIVLQDHGSGVAFRAISVERR